jgi:hypothetical protein
MRRWLVPVLLTLFPLLTAAGFPFNKPRPLWSRQFNRNPDPVDFTAVAADEEDSVWLAGTELWKLDPNGERQRVIDELAPPRSERVVTMTNGRKVVENQQVNALVDLRHPFRTGERAEAVSAIAFLADHRPLLVFQMARGRVVCGALSRDGRFTRLDEIGSDREQVIIHAALTADDHAIYLLGERLGSAYLVRLDENGRLEWRRQLVWGGAGARGKSRLIDGFPLARGGVQVIGELDPSQGVPQVRVVQIAKSGDAGKEISFPGRPIALAGGAGRDSVALYESAGPEPGLTLCSLDENLAENWRKPLPIPGRASDGGVQLKAAADEGTLAAAAVDGRLWAVRLDRHGQTVWEFRPEYRARSVKVVTAQPARFLLLTALDGSDGQTTPPPALALDKFAESE